MIAALGDRPNTVKTLFKSSLNSKQPAPEQFGLATSPHHWASPSPPSLAPDQPNLQPDLRDLSGSIRIYKNRPTAPDQSNPWAKTLHQSAPKGLGWWPVNCQSSANHPLVKSESPQPLVK